MSYLWDKFKGKYRLKAPYSLDTNDFPKKLNGTYEDIDVYIDCQHGNKVFHYGRQVLQCYIPSIIRGHNIIKAIKEINPDMIFDIEETDSEVLFKFKFKDSDSIIPLLKPKISSANRSPFSVKNLPKTDYEIPSEDLEAYKNITAKIPPEKVLSIGLMTNRFLQSLVTKKNPWENIKADMKKKGLRGREYIHSIGKWSDYLKYLDKELKVLEKEL